MLGGDASCNMNYAHTPTCLEVYKPAAVEVTQSHAGSVTMDNGKTPPGTVRQFCDPTPF